MATSSLEQKTSLDELPNGSLYAPSESDSLYSELMDQDSEEWPMADAKPIDDQSQPLSKEKAQLNLDGDARTCQPAQLYRLYTALWEGYNKVVADLRRVEDDNCILRSANIQLCHQLQASERRILDQASLLAYSEQGFQNFRVGIRTVLDAWETSAAKTRTK